MESPVGTRGHPSLQTAGSLLRSRSREPAWDPALYTAAGRPRRPQPEHSLEELIAQQVALLQEQTLLLRQQSAAQNQSDDKFLDPSRILDSLDPALKSVMSKWRVDFCKDLSHFATQTELSEKYDKIQAHGEIMKQFGEESKRKWQWPKAYEAVAQPISSIEDEQIDESHVYDINEAWAGLRRRHALECQSFIMHHQKQALALFANKVSVASVQQNVDDLWEDSKGKFGSLHSESSLRASQGSCRRLMQMVMRDEVPKMKSRLQEAADHRNKREAAVLDAETKYQQMDPQQLIALLQLDGQAVRVKTRGSWAKQVTICKGSELAGLVKQFPDLENFFDIKIVDKIPLSSSRTSSRPKPCKGRAPTPFPRHRGSSQNSRSSSKQSRSSGRSRSASKSKRTSRSTSRRPTSTERKKGNGKGGKPNGKGHGKGKGKGKHKGKKGDNGIKKRVSWGRGS